MSYGRRGFRGPVCGIERIQALSKSYGQDGEELEKV
jgi:hypothetical protein